MKKGLIVLFIVIFLLIVSAFVYIKTNSNKIKEDNSKIVIVNSSVIEENCVKEGERLTVGSQKCCEGLNISQTQLDSYCVKCGDGICSQQEYLYQCPSDCKIIYNNSLIQLKGKLEFGGGPGGDEGNLFTTNSGENFYVFNSESYIQYGHKFVFINAYLGKYNKDSPYDYLNITNISIDKTNPYMAKDNYCNVSNENDCIYSQDYKKCVNDFYYHGVFSSDPECICKNSVCILNSLKLY